MGKVISNNLTKDIRKVFNSSLIYIAFHDSTYNAPNECTNVLVDLNLSFDRTMFPYRDNLMLVRYHMIPHDTIPYHTNEYQHEAHLLYTSLLEPEIARCAFHNFDLQSQFDTWYRTD